MFGFLLGTLVSLIVFTIALSFGEALPFLQVAQATGSIAIGISAIVGINLYITTTRRHVAEDSRKRSQEYLGEAINLLERAYSKFTDDGENIEPPRNDRLLWLTTARFIVRYIKIKEKITEQDHLNVIEEHEEYWRTQFYEVLSKNRSNFNLAYFMPSGHPYNGDVVHRDSVGVVFYFSKWPDDNDDPLHGVDAIGMYARSAVPIDQFGVEEFIEQYDDYNSKIQARKQELTSGSNGS